VVQPQTLNPYLTNTLGIGGCDRALNAITDTTGIIFPDYDGNGGVSERVDYWIVNDTPLPLPTSVRIGITAAIDKLPFAPVPNDSILKAGLLQLTFLGYVNTTTGALDTTNAPVTVTYQGNNPMSLTLPRELPPKHAYVLGIQAEFRNSDLHNTAMQGSLIQIYPYFEENYSIYVPFGDIFGDFVSRDGDRRRIVPAGSGLNLKALSGSGCVKSYGFKNVGESLVVGLAINADNQKVLISNNATCFVGNDAGDTTALRAVVSTINGVGGASSWSDPVALSTASSLELTLTHPTAIRASYPDVIGGMSATLNALKVRVYLRNTANGTIHYAEALISGLSDETVLIGSVIGTINFLPAVAQDFGLFDPPSYTSALMPGGSSLPVGNFEIAIAYLYENTVTKISHSLDLSCIDEWETDFVELLKIQNSWGSTVIPASGQSVDDAIRNISQSDTSNGQTRRVLGNPFIFYDATLTSAEVLLGNWNNRVWRPVWRTPEQPGRWRGDIGVSVSGSILSYDALMLDFQTNKPATNNSQLALFNESGVASLRMPNSGAVYPIATLGSPSSIRANNALINGLFQVSQTANSWTLTAGAGFNYIADLWHGAAGIAGGATVSIVSFLVTDGSIGAGTANALRWNQTTAANDNPKLRSRIESVATLAGQVVTLSFYALATTPITISTNFSQNFGVGGSGAADVNPKNFTIGTTRSRYTYTTTIPNLSAKVIGTADDSLDVIFSLPAGSLFQIDIDSVELIIGNTPSFITPPHISQTLNGCLRYLYRLAGSANQAIGSGRANVANIAQIAVNFPVPMRTAPKLSGFNDLVLNANVAVTAIALNGVGVNSATVELTTTIAAGGACIGKLNSAASFVIFDARMPLT
jgi:hypothetical protein